MVVVCESFTQCHFGELDSWHHFLTKYEVLPQNAIFLGSSFIFQPMVRSLVQQIFHMKIAR